MFANKGSKFMAWAVIVAFFAAVPGQAAEMARIITESKVNVYRGGQLVQVISENAPLPEGALLKPEGICGVRMPNLNLVAEAGSSFAVVPSGNDVELALDEGMLYFIASAATGRVSFRTPAGVIIARQFIVHAAADGIVKGMLQVKGGATTLAVLEGGDILVSTVDGERTIRSGEQMLLAQAEGQNAATATTAESGAGLPNWAIAGAAIAAVGLGAAALGSGGGGGSSPAPVSPAAP